MAPERTYIDEIWKWYCDFKNYSFVFNSDNQNAYSFHAWSIPLEFRGSIVIYTTLLALSRCGTVSRLRTQLVLIFYFLYVVDGWYCALFLMGMFLCDTDLLAMKQQLPRFYARIRFESHRPWVIYLLLIIGLYLGGVPALSNDIEFLRNTPGWYYLSFLKPQAVFNFAWFYRFFAAYLVMICIPRLRWLQSFFESSFCQYLGRISFGFYLVHGPILWSIGDRVYAAVGCTREAHHIMVPWYINKFAFPSVGIFGLELNFFAAQMVLLPLTLWTAEIFTRLVDEPSVKLTQWLFKTHTSEEQDFLV
jgi:peptidoglycan/LPS O-acetylase OafA/YrhL